MMPVPTTATEAGRVAQLKTSSLTTSRSPSADRQPLGTFGEAPVAMMMQRAVISVPSTTSTPGFTKRAWPRRRCASGQSLTVSTTKPTKRSRSSRTLCMTAWPSMVWGLAFTPKCGASRTARAASAAAISSLLGMQPTRAQVVP